MFLGSTELVLQTIHFPKVYLVRALPGCTLPVRHIYFIRFLFLTLRVSIPNKAETLSHPDDASME